MPRVKFKWDELPAPLLRRLARDLEVDRADIPAGLRRWYGARPREAFVQDAWPTLREGWLARDRAVRRSVVDALRARGLGVTTIDVRTATGQLDYLRSCRNGTSLRQVVLEHLIVAGEPSAGPAKPRTPEVTQQSAPDARAAGSAAWPSFVTSLGEVLDALHDDTFLILTVKRNPRLFVQFAAQGPQGLQAELVSNSYLEGPEQLDEDAVSRALELGWKAPTSGPEATPRDDPDGSPNFFREWGRPVPYVEVGDLVVETLVGVLDVPHPGFLAYDAFDDGGQAILLPTLGLSRSTQATTTGGAGEPAVDLRAEFESLISAMLGEDTVVYDDDGDVAIRFGSAMVFVRLVEDPGVVMVHSPALWDVPFSAALLQTVNDLNQRLLFVRATWQGGCVSIQAELPVEPFVGAQIAHAIQAVGAVADDVDEALQAQFGGTIFFGGSLPASQDPATGGYL